MIIWVVIKIYGLTDSLVIVKIPDMQESTRGQYGQEGKGTPYELVLLPNPHRRNLPFTLHTQYDSSFSGYIGRPKGDRDLPYEFGIVGIHDSGRIQPYFIENGDLHPRLIRAMFCSRSHELKGLEAAIGVQMNLKNGKIELIVFKYVSTREDMSIDGFTDAGSYVKYTPETLACMAAFARAIPQDAFVETPDGSIPVNFQTDKEGSCRVRWNVAEKRITRHSVIRFVESS